MVVTVVVDHSSPQLLLLHAAPRDDVKLKRKGAAEGLVSSFVTLTRPYHERLHRIACSLCNDPDQAADLTQEALIRALRAFDRFDDSRPVLPWLARILKNAYLDSLKTGRHRHEVAEHQLGGREQNPVAMTASAMPDPQSLTERAQVGAILREEVAALDPDHRLVVTLCDIEGFSYKEAAEVAGVPVGTIRSRLSRCRMYLRERILLRLKKRTESGTALLFRS